MLAKFTPLIPPRFTPLQLPNPSLLKALNQSCQVGSAGAQQQLQALHELHDGQLLGQALHELHDGQLLGQALHELHDGQLLGQALHELHDGQLLGQLLHVLHEAAPADAVNATTKKIASKTPVNFFIVLRVCFIIHSPPDFRLN
jgi:hypothetical protein